MDSKNSRQSLSREAQRGNTNFPAVKAARRRYEEQRLARLKQERLLARTRRTGSRGSLHKEGAPCALPQPTQARTTRGSERAEEKRAKCPVLRGPQRTYPVP